VSENSSEDGDLLARIAPLREKIDAIDDELLKLFNERAGLAQDIGKLKHNAVAWRPDREAAILRRLSAANPGPLSAETVRTVFKELISACMALERPLSIAYLGPAGTFSHSAGIKHFGQAAGMLPAPSIDDVFRLVESGQANYAVVPVENSTEGAIGRTLDLMQQTPLTICGEVELRIHHHLMSRAPTLDKVSKVYSHAQSLGQCQNWLKRNLPHAARLSVASNAEAARLASEDPESAAIAGDTAAVAYSLPKLAEHVEDEPNNTTRFWVLGAHEIAPSGRDKTSFILSAKNRPGAVYALLAPFARHGVSMTRFESRPSRTQLWEYVFFVDVEGHVHDEPVRRAVSELKDIALLVKTLGSYPAALI
jgi:chorismate mutase/prephenate dehydratase